ncbi:hypothetical protein SCALM49S_03009 [Streptomyces californicus]
MCTRVSTTPIAAKPSGSETPYPWYERTPGGVVRAIEASSAPLASSVASSPAGPASRSAKTALDGPPCRSGAHR